MMETTENSAVCTAWKIIYPLQGGRFQVDLEEDRMIKAYVSVAPVALDTSGKPWLWDKRLLCSVDKHGVILLNESRTGAIMMKKIGGLCIDGNALIASFERPSPSFTWSITIRDEEASETNEYFSEERLQFVEAFIEHVMRRI